jgi:GH25 family lysozyme M1 (1,4-beta-N-acetylmuramidase)
MVYHFIYLDNATIKENAKATVENMKKAGLDPENTWIAADLEYDTWKKLGVKCTKEKCTKYTEDYLNELKKLGCKKLFIYMNDDYYDHYYDLTLVKQYPLWFANPGRGAAHGCVMYQTKVEKVAGIANPVDINWLYDESMIQTSSIQEKTTIKTVLNKILKPKNTVVETKEAALEKAFKVEPAESFNKKIARKYTTTADLNLRTGANTNKKVLLVIPKGKKVTCYGYYTKDWYYVQYGKIVGFCSKKYLK